LILQEDDGFAGHFPRSGDMRGSEHLAFFCFRIAGTIRVIKEAESEFYSQNPPDGCVKNLCGDFSVLHQSGKVVPVDIRSHIHVQTGFQRLLRGLRSRRRNAVVQKLADGIPVAHDKPVEFPLIAENVGEEMLVGAARNTVDLIERCHQCAGACIHRRLERNEVHIAKRPFGNFRGVIITSPLRRAVRGEVFRACEDRRGIGEITALVSAHLGRCHRSPQERVFTRPLRDPSHRGSRAISTIGPNVQCTPAADASRAATTRRSLHSRRIPACRLRQGNGKRRAETVDHVKTEEQGDPRVRFFDGDPLQLTRDPGAEGVQE